PVLAPTILRKESVAASFKGPQFDARRAMPEAWKRGRGQFTTTISTSPWLPQMSGLPVILQYPHGCFEQISTKLLGYSLLANVLAYLPDFQQRDAEYKNESQELYLHRNEGSDEDRAFLAIALHQQNIMAHEQQQLLREIDKPIKERAFNPATFTSMTRAEAMRAFAFNMIAPPTWTNQRKQQTRDRMSKLMDDAGSLSTQENLWLLLAFTSML